MADRDLQSIVDELAERLRRSVAIDDPAIRLLAASRHFGDEDALRVSSVMNRAVEPRIVDHILAQGISRWVAPGVVDVEGAMPRLCAPVRCNGMLLGYLWLIDRDGTFTEHEMAAAGEAAATAGAMLLRRLLLHERSKARQEGILRELVSGDLAVRAQAIEDLRAEQLFGDESSHFTVLAVQCRAAAAPQEVAFEAAVEEGVRAVTGDVALMAANRSRAWILLVQRVAPSRGLVDAVAERITTRFRRLGDENAPPVFGLGGTVTALGDVVTSYREALLAARAALLLPGIGSLARWGELGPYELLLKLPPEDLLTASPVPALAAIEQEDTHDVLLTTLTDFFDHAGNIQRTADSLRVHRATLYQRLKRIEQITGCSLDSGDDRLMLHLGLKLRVIAAAYRDHLGR
ncbi:PucR C-terminal helix-turn-helix domain-containing protein [Amycolatopsis pretoriensis]|uniref:PucR C-terminal helix-turn-helix domain-containing protein n=1 Tax=Amycolatopsis pretoriensis TaxID=218821 RepID=A0A1H5RL62_9PSEU|nr:helix-turn-helix domain-containing protein [Amycolatopsis pretoriensis]SEF38251.1 PucR C-terminal helix-turn-helix domain-containing protein [Amycolatopsis pretoriensis]